MRDFEITDDDKELVTFTNSKGEAKLVCISKEDAKLLVDELVKHFILNGE